MLQRQRLVIILAITFVTLGIVSSCVVLLAPHTVFRGVLEVLVSGHTVADESVQRARLFGTFVGFVCLVFGMTLLVTSRFVATLLDTIPGPLSLWLDLKSFLRDEEKAHLASIGFVCFVGAGLRLMFLFQPMRYDEAYTFTNFASHALWDGLSNYSVPNNHLLHTFLVHLTYKAFGNEPWALRVPTLVAGILLMPASYWAVRLLYDKNVAILAVAMVSASSILVEYSTNARGYTLLTLLYLLLIGATVHIKRTGSGGAWLAFVLISSLGFFTIPIFLYPFGSMCLWLLLSATSKDTHQNSLKLLRSLIVACIVTALVTVILYSPVLFRSGWRSIVSNPFVAPKDLPSVVTALPSSITSTWTGWTRDIPGPVALVFLGFFVGSIVFTRRGSRKDRLPLMLPILWFCIAAVLTQRVVVDDRVWLFMLPLYFAEVSAGLVALIDALTKGSKGHLPTWYALGAVLFCVLIGANISMSKSILRSEATGTLPAAQEITLYLASRLEPTDRVIAKCPADAPLRYYFDRAGLSPTYFRNDPSKAKAVFVIVKHGRHSLESLLAEYNLHGEADLIQTYKGVSLYLVK